MILGHGDDAWRFERPIQANFSSNVYSRVDLTALKAHLAARLDAIGHYPEPEPYALERALAVRLGLDPASVCVTNGATEAIYLTAHAFAGSQTTILQPTFSEYADACMLYSHRLIPCATPPGPRTCQLFWLCNPNNPTGDVIPKEELVKTIEAYPETIFVIDQSYGYFTKEPLLSAAEAVTFPNVIQLHSMTKRYAMPGIRLGYITANPQLVERIRAVRMPWSVNAMAIEAGLYLCDHPDTAPIDLPALLRETQRLRYALDSLPGLSALPTRTHFFLCRLDRGRAASLKEWLAEEHGLLIRDAANFEELDERYFRIAAQTPEENDRLVAAVRQYLKEVAS
ncbi:MAG: pyridoxal phosphate-dependent class II aminotransferase [Bacteroidales bacterium]|nr:pyridoxal phosphate-dependent class II aminotransferase [Bacteroidales bacterium]